MIDVCYVKRPKNNLLWQCNISETTKTLWTKEHSIESFIKSIEIFLNKIAERKSGQTLMQYQKSLTQT